MYMWCATTTTASGTRRLDTMPLSIQGYNHDDEADDDEADGEKTMTTSYLGSQLLFYQVMLLGC